MCLAIAPNRKAADGFFSRLWRRASSTPFRLLTLSGSFHTLVLDTLMILSALILVLLGPAKGSTVSL